MSNISLLDADGALKKVQAKIQDLQKVPNDTAIEGVGQIIPDARMDLIAHAKGGILQFGDWHVGTPEDGEEAVAESWGNKRPDELRILGCTTAVTSEGIAALKRLKKTLGIKSVYGTTAPMVARNFGPEGLLYKDEVFLVEASTLPDRGAEISESVVAKWFENFDEYSFSHGPILSSLQPEDPDDVKAAQAKNGISAKVIEYSAFENAVLHTRWAPPARAPGLLAIPETEIVAEAPGHPGSIVRLSVFLGGAFIRIYPVGEPDGVLLRAQGRVHPFTRL